MMTNRLIAGVAMATVVLAGCASEPRYVDPAADDGPVAMTADYRDFDQAARLAVEDLLASGVLPPRSEEPAIMVVSRVTNDTMQRIDTDQLIKKIRVALLRSGRVITTTAVGPNGGEDAMNRQVRELRTDDEFDSGTVQNKGTLQAPELSLSGKILQTNHRVGKDQQVEYYFQLSLTDLRRGLAIWENEVPIIKRGPNDSVVW